MRGDIQKIFFETLKKKQVMMFSATMSSEMRQVCKKDRGMFKNDRPQILIGTPGRVLGLARDKKHAGDSKPMVAEEIQKEVKTKVYGASTNQGPGYVRALR